MSCNYDTAEQPSRENARNTLKRIIADVRQIAASQTESAADRLKMCGDFEALLNELPPALSGSAERALIWLVKKI